ncbi:MAG: lamin tail domain-containing protein [Chloroflexota bacterium]|nr:MAG: lamin tail domain-containing protein [Chloroflexota bacterium]
MAKFHFWVFLLVAVAVSIGALMLAAYSSPLDLNSDYITPILPLDWVFVQDLSHPTYFPLLFRRYSVSQVSPPQPPAGFFLLISEVMYASEDGDPALEWIEIYNPFGQTASLEYNKLGDEENCGGSEGMLRFPPGSTLAPRHTAVIANSADAFRQLYEFAPDFEWNDSDPAVPNMLVYAACGTRSLNLANGGDEVIFLDANDHWMDALSYGTSSLGLNPPIPTVPAGHSLERYPPWFDQNLASDWREQDFPSPHLLDLTPPTATPTATSTATPISTSVPTSPPVPTPIPTATLVPVLIINEILADPGSMNGDANGDQVIDSYQDEFIEVVNMTGETVDLSGWTIENSMILRHTIPPGTMINHQCALLVFGGGAPQGLFGNAVVQLASSSRLILGNSGDTVQLFDATGHLVFSYTYGPEGGDDQSLTRFPDILGADPLVRHFIATGNTLYFSPGTKVDGSPFSGCVPSPGYSK